MILVYSCHLERLRKALCHAQQQEIIESHPLQVPAAPPPTHSCTKYNCITPLPTHTLACMQVCEVVVYIVYWN
jgi:hypothetical protein